eukprot:scaffold5818_cov84-Cylindrotheca_fusiformis.AAC.1
MTNKSSYILVFYWASSLLLLWLLLLLQSVHTGALPCDSDAYCQTVYGSPDSVCLLNSTKECSNPFQKGCLRSKGLVDYDGLLRVCTSSDDDDPDEMFCRKSRFPYPEIRIHNGDWSTSFWLAWIYQIVLVELLGVPVSVGLTTDAARKASFYALENNKLEYSTTAYPYEALIEANIQIRNGGNCEDTNKPCVHVLPEVWAGQRSEWLRLLDDGEIDRPEPNGMLQTSNFFLPAFTIQEYPSLGVFYGFQGDENRKLLAELFKKPTTWKDYCQLVSSTNCSIADDTASRYPNNESEEEDKYFLDGLYKGFFRATEKNNCTVSDDIDDCHGYFVAPA